MALSDTGDVAGGEERHERCYLVGIRESLGGEPSDLGELFIEPIQRRSSLLGERGASSRRRRSRRSAVPAQHQLLLS